MKIIKVIEKEVVADEVMILDLCNNEPGNTVVSEVYVDLPETNTITLSGSVDGKTWHLLKVVDMGNLSKVDAISSAGYFLISTAGLSKVKLVFGSTGKVVIKETY